MEKLEKLEKPNRSPMTAAQTRNPPTWKNWKNPPDTVRRPGYSSYSRTVLHCVMPCSCGFAGCYSSYSSYSTCSWTLTLPHHLSSRDESIGHHSAGSRERST